MAVAHRHAIELLATQGQDLKWFVDGRQTAVLQICALTSSEQFTVICGGKENKIFVLCGVDVVTRYVPVKKTQ